MHTFHNRAPEILWIRSSCSTHLLGVVIIAPPYHTGIVWCKSSKQRISIACCSTRFTCLNHPSSKICTCSGSSCHNIFHCVSKKPCSLFFHNTVTFLCLGIIQNHISIMVKYLRIKTWCDIFSLISDCCICTRQFQIGDTFCKSSQ